MYKMQTVNVMMKQASLTRFEAAEPKRPRPEQKPIGTAKKPSSTAKRRRRNTLVLGFSYESFFGNVASVKRFLNNSTTDVNQVDETGQTPLYVACWKGHVDVVRLLLAFVKWETREQGKWYYPPSWAQAAFSTFYVRNEWPDNIINRTRLVVAGGAFTPTQFDNITSFPTTTFQLTGFNLFTQDNGIQCPVRCLPCKHVFNAADLHQNRTFSKKCPSCNKVPTRIALMSEIEIKRWNYMESQEKKGDVHIDKLREQEKALQNERVNVQAAVDANNFQHRYRQFVKRT